MCTAMQIDAHVEPGSLQVGVYDGEADPGEPQRPQSHRGGAMSSKGSKPVDLQVHRLLFFARGSSLATLESFRM